MKFTSVLPVVSLASLALSANVDVTVGPGNIFTPDTVTAAQGDVVRFRFGSGHNVVSGKFDTPCQPDNVIYSGSPRDGDVFSVTVNNTNPIWIYCSVSRHCEVGMAMVINAPSNQTVAAYKRAAASVSSSSTPNNVAGGTFNAQTSNATTTSTSPSSASTAAQASSTTARSGSSKVLGSADSVIGAAFAALAVALGFATL